uniref:Nuclear nucleic acid-binding protein C1D n=1 Tax=Gadus morhua TaxID=8049 RepID=A0A8C5A3R0_GADMO
MSAEAEGYPAEIQEQLTGFESSVGVINSMLQTMVSMPRNDLLQKLDPLDQAKLDLMSAYTLNSLFWMYLVTRGQNPREHGVKQELVSTPPPLPINVSRAAGLHGNPPLTPPPQERIRGVMTRVKDITDRKKAARLDKGAAARFLRHALYDAEEGRAKRPTPGRAPKTPTPQTGHAPKTPAPQTGHAPKTPAPQTGRALKKPTPQTGRAPMTPTPTKKPRKK